MKLTPEQRDWLALSLVPGVGSSHFVRLLAHYHTPGAVLRTPARELADVVGPKLAPLIAQYGASSDVDEQVRRMKAAGAHLVTMEDPSYPEPLAEIYDPPLVLFVRGELRESDVRAIALVGTRKPSPYGLRMAEQLGRELGARGICVISGLAAGIDAAAHRTAIEAGGRTIAVLGCGVDVVYPKENADLYELIAQHGAVISQFPMGMKPLAGNFPYRNRIVSGLAMGTVVIEAPMASGALITARTAAEQGREVFAVPGQVGIRNAEGCHALIKQGAKLCESADDILVELPALKGMLAAAQRDAAPAAESAIPPLADRPNRRAEPERAKRPAAPSPAAVPSPPPPPAPPSAAPKASGVEGKVLASLSQDGSFVDEIASRCSLSIAEALSTLTMMELKGLVRQYSGKRFAPR